MDLITLALAKKYTDEKAGSGGGNVQPDWNQNDETAPDYVKNRPFYKYSNEILVKCNANDHVNLNDFPLFGIGDTVNVNINGTDYSLIAVDSGNKLVTIGDTYTEFMNGTGQYGWTIGNSGGYVSVTSKNNITIRYMSDNLIYSELFMLVRYENGSLDKTLNEINKAYNAGLRIVLYDVASNIYANIISANSSSCSFIENKSSGYLSTYRATSKNNVSKWSSFLPSTMLVNQAYTVSLDDKFVLKSSTFQSQKKFVITVDDSGTISATEVTS